MPLESLSKARGSASATLSASSARQDKVSPKVEAVGQTAVRLLGHKVAVYHLDSVARHVGINTQ